MTGFLDLVLSKKQCGFRKGFNEENCLLVMIEKWRQCLDQGGFCSALLTDLSKAFDVLPHSLLVAKLNAYGFDLPSVRLMYSYLTNRKQTVKINNTYSDWSEIFYGVPQGSILGPLLFNIFLADLFLFIPNIDIANYADDNTPYATGMDANRVLEELRNTSDILLNWFNINLMKANPDKSHLINSNDKEIKMKVGDTYVTNSKCEKLLGIKIDNKLSFEPHVDSLCRKASQKLNALSRIVSSITFEQRKIILNSFIISQFSYCPLIWMFHSRKLNSRINRIHERALRLVYKDNLSNFQELLLKDNSVTIHQRNLRKLVTEIFKVKIEVAPEIMKNVFNIIGSHYNLRNDTNFNSRNIYTVKYGRETPSFIGPQVWRTLPMEYKLSSSIEEFKAKIKEWVPENCPCNLCKTYIQHVGYI